jgi:hypothetical protein
VTNLRDKLAELSFIRYDSNDKRGLFPEEMAELLPTIEAEIGMACEASKIEQIERCAQVADKHVNSISSIGHLHAMGIQNAAEWIAKEIRVLAAFKSRSRSAG